jgi:hypothetical protein
VALFTLIAFAQGCVRQAVGTHVVSTAYVARANDELSSSCVLACNGGESDYEGASEEAIECVRKCPGVSRHQNTACADAPGARLAPCRGKVERRKTYKANAGAIVLWSVVGGAAVMFLGFAALKGQGES